jgi:asparagine synthase (glutamine-hydrolysing)
MCGISAIFKKVAAPVDPRDLRLISSAIAHRGPDDAGYTILCDNRVGLAHVRLSILDLSSGAQPLFSVDGSMCIVFNGEIYDHESLRRTLIVDGFEFQTKTDTEVVLALYQKHGLDFFEHLNGEFAFVIWDERKRRMVAVKDRIGIKPLFFYQNQNEIIICSEAKGILALERVPRAISPTYVTGPMLGAFPKATSLFEGVESLKPGHFLLIEDGHIMEERAYWKQHYVTHTSMSIQDAEEGIRHHFRNAVKRRMVADVPICTYLSGGLDSTLVCATMAEFSTSRLKAFNIGFSASEYDESSQARDIADFYGVEFESLSCRMEDLTHHLVDTLYHTETHLANPSAIGKYLLSERVYAQGFKVTLTGEGADEIFAGYPYFKVEHIWRLLLGNHQEQALAKSLWKRFRQMEAKSEGVLWNRKSKWRDIQPLFGYPSFIQTRSEEYVDLIAKAFNPGFVESRKYLSPREMLEANFAGEGLDKIDPLQASLFITLSQLAGYIIPTLGDRVEMAHSIEGRTPFLDRDLVEFAATIPPRYLLDIKRLQEKAILRSAFNDILPDSIKAQHKHPFFSQSWYKFSQTKMGKEIFGEFLSPTSVKNVGIFNPLFLKKVQKLWKLLPQSTGMHKRLDTLLGVTLSVQIMHNLFVAKQPKANADFEMKLQMPSPRLARKDAPIFDTSLQTTQC